MYKLFCSSTKKIVSLYKLKVYEICYSDTNLDPFCRLCAEEGEIDTTLFLDDNIHLNTAGYARWTKLLRPLLIK